MRVYILAENWPPRVGGIEHYLLGLVRSLPASTITVVAPRVDEEDVAIGETNAAQVVVVRKRFFWPVVKPAWLFLFIWLWRRARQGEVDVLICGKGLFEGLVGSYLKRYLNVPFVVCTYAMEIERWQAAWRTRRKLTRVLQAADRVLYINEHTKQALVELGVSPAQLLKLPPGVDDHHFLPAPATEAVLKKYTVSQPYILVVARLVPRKGVDIVLEAFSQLDQVAFGDVQLVIVGDGPEQAALRRLARTLFIATSVRFVGEVSDLELRALYQEALFFALTPRELPGDIEGFGMVYIEAAAYGLPALATSTGGVPEAVIDGQTGLLVQVDDVAAVTAGLTRLLKDDELRKTLGLNAKARAQADFQWSARAEQLQAALSSFVT